MKKLDELGISPWPWHTFEDNWVESADVLPAMSNAAYDEENCFVQRWREVLANAAGESEVEVQHD